MYVVYEEGRKKWDAIEDAAEDGSAVISAPNRGGRSERLILPASHVPGIYRSPATRPRNIAFFCLSVNHHHISHHIVFIYHQRSTSHFHHQHFKQRLHFKHSLVWGLFNRIENPTESSLESLFDCSSFVAFAHLYPPQARTSHSIPTLHSSLPVTSLPFIAHHEQAIRRLQ